MKERQSAEIGEVQKTERTSIELLAIREEDFAGPLPHPSILAEYAAIKADAPEIIFRMAEEAQDHERLMEYKAATNAEKELELKEKQLTYLNQQEGSKVVVNCLGIFLAFTVSILCIVCATILYALGKDGHAFLTGAAILVTALSVFIVYNAFKK
ncbi:hypothetical protein DB346_06455 [Verrucomicrobia bacterium LW23]|nr:hypothetical protein DB346_06455 [Verrucomicrobia bacterium LW23]